MELKDGSYFETNGTKLSVRAWVPAEYHVAVLVVHGLAEHSGRYDHVAKHLNQNGIAVFGFDGRGHGRSVAQPQAYFPSWEEYSADIRGLWNQLKATVGDRPCFIYGHSMGGLLVSYCEVVHPLDCTGIMLTGAFLELPAEVNWFLERTTGLLSRYWPRLPLTRLDAQFISRDAAEVQRYHEDPLNYRGPIRARVLAELFAAIKVVSAKRDCFTHPVLIMHGAADKLTPPEGSQALYEGIQSTDKTLKIWDDCYHELVNEPEQQAVLELMTSWMLERS